MRPKSEIYTPKRDDEHPPPPRDRSLKKFELGAWFFFPWLSSYAVRSKIPRRGGISVKSTRQVDLTKKPCKFLTEQATNFRFRRSIAVYQTPYHVVEFHQTTIRIF